MERIAPTPQDKERVELSLYKASLRDLLAEIRKRLFASLSSSPQEETPYEKGLRAIYSRFRKDFPNDESDGFIDFHETEMKWYVYHPFRSSYLAIACNLTINKRFVGKEIYRIPLKVFRSKKQILQFDKDYPPSELVDELTRNLNRTGCTIFVYQ